MTKKEPTITEFIKWVSKLNDSYKIFLFSTINALFLFVYITTGQNIDPDSIKELIVSSFVKSTGNEALNSLWANIAQPILWVIGLLQIGIHYMQYGNLDLGS